MLEEYEIPVAAVHLDVALWRGLHCTAVGRVVKDIWGW